MDVENIYDKLSITLLEKVKNEDKGYKIIKIFDIIYMVII